MNNTPYTFGKHPGKDPAKMQAFQPLIPQAQLPKNWSYEYLFDQVDNQGQVGTCVAHGCVAIAEAFNFKRHQTRIEMSRIALYSQAKHSYEPTDINGQGLYVSDGLKVLTTYGYVPESELPYRDDPDAIIQPVDPTLWRRDFLLHTFVAVPERDAASMKVAIMQHGPLIIGIPWAHAWSYPDADGTMPQPDTVAGGHCVLIIGYSDTRQAFRVRNSWGAQWGDNGYAWLPYSVLGTPFAPDDVYTCRA